MFFSLSFQKVIEREKLLFLEIATNVPHVLFAVCTAPIRIPTQPSLYPVLLLLKIAIFWYVYGKLLSFHEDCKILAIKIEGFEMDPMVKMTKGILICGSLAPIIMWITSYPPNKPPFASYLEMFFLLLLMIRENLSAYLFDCASHIFLLTAYTAEYLYYCQN